MAARRIMIVDDEEGFTRMAKLVLEDTGRFEVLEENEPTLALTAARRFRPDLIVMDILMPGRSGIEVASEIMKDPDLAKRPIIFLSAAISKQQVSVDDDTLRRCKLLTKPIGGDELIAHIDASLGA